MHLIGCLHPLNKPYDFPSVILHRSECLETSANCFITMRRRHDAGTAHLLNEVQTQASVPLSNLSVSGLLWARAAETLASSNPRSLSGKPRGLSRKPRFSSSNHQPPTSFPDHHPTIPEWKKIVKSWHIHHVLNSTLNFPPPMTSF